MESLRQSQYVSSDLEPVRSCHYRTVSGLDFTHSAMGGRMIQVVDANDDSRVKSAGLIDLSLLPRVGYRGKGVESFLSSQGIAVPNKPNRAAISPEGELVLRLSLTEFWVVGSLKDLGSSVIGLPRQHTQTPANCYPLFCEDSHACFVLTGEHIANVMAKLCAVNLREDAFPVGHIAQTSVARTSCIVVRHQVEGVPCFMLLSDATAGEYMLGILLDALTEYQGGLCGTACLI